MTGTSIPFELNHKPGVLEVWYEANQSIIKSGFDLFAGSGFDANLCLGYPTMHAFVSAFEGTGYYTASAWIQMVTRREFVSIESATPMNIITDVDVHPTLAELGVPFFAMGFPAEIYDAPCNNLGSLGKLEWIADTFLVTLPSRINNNSISRIAGFQWGYCEYDLDGKRQVVINPLVATEVKE
ncbi:MAG: hypothetical protein IH586_15725, partial [Anaerolineaceae bacterium]|nr:hypothetical protein [Anaerolineaceae bacterium]